MARLPCRDTESGDSGKTTLASTTAIGSRIADVAYDGSALASSTTYYWRIKFYDSYSGEGAWSTTPATFILAKSVLYYTYAARTARSDRN